jgi:hypothetical protein
MVTGLVFSLMAGIFHAYYTVALAPAIAALVAIGGGLLWQRRGHLWARIVLAATLGLTACWSFMLLGRSADFVPWLKWLILVTGLAAAVGLLIADRVGRLVVTTVLTVGLLAGLGGPTAYALQTAATTHTGSIPSAGPAVTGGMMFGRLGRGLGTPPTARPNGTAPGGLLGMPPVPGTGTIGRFGGMAGLLHAGEVSDRVAAALSENASAYRWVAATIGANNAAGYQLATQLPVMPLGGFNGSDPSPTLAQFQRYVADGQVHWFIGGGMGMRSIGGSNSAHAIAAWVQANFTSQTVDGATLYDLTQ